MLECLPDTTPSPTFWAHPHDQSLQPLYLHYFFFYNVALRNYFTNLYTIGWVALPPCQLKGLAALSLAHAPPWHPPAALAPAKWSGQSPTAVIEGEGCSSSIMDTHSHNHLHGYISILASPHLHISSPGALWGLTPPIPPLPRTHPPRVHHPPAASARPLL